MEGSTKAVADAARVTGLLALEAALADNRTSGTDTATSGGTDDPRDGIINQCAGALGELDKRAARLASEKSALQAFARDVCLIQ